MVGELASAKVWTIDINDSVSLYQCLMGRCASVLRSGDFEKMSAERASGEMIDAESDVLTFAVECLYFETGDEAARSPYSRSPSFPSFPPLLIFVLCFQKERI